MSKVSHHRKKKIHAKKRKSRHKIVSRKDTPSIGVFSSLRRKFNSAFAICQRLIAIVLCILIFLSFSIPITFAFMQNLQPAKSENVSYFRYSVIPLTFKSIIVSFADEPLKKSIHTLARLQEKALEVASTDPVETEEVRNETGIPNIVYLHSRQSFIPYISRFPEVVEEQISEDDIAVDLSHAFDSGVVYDCSAELEHVFCCIVERESGNQPLLGKLLVAEGVVSRVYSGAYGPSTMVNAILRQGYLAEEDNEGKLHIRNREGKEITSYSEDVQKAVRLALNGSRVSHTILKAVTEWQNVKYGLQLDDTYYQWGTIYHYNPAAIEEHQLRSRSIRRAPVSFQFVDHVFYGYWLPESLQLNL